MSFRQIQVSEALKEARKLLPNLSDALVKGSSGRIAIVGGSDMFSGAPYFAGRSALLMGTDLCYIHTIRSAATAIKSMSPDLMVVPWDAGRDVEDTGTLAMNATTQIKSIMPRLHSVVVGPGLGTYDPALEIATFTIKSAIEHKIPLVIDADAIRVLTKSPDIIKGYQYAIITPNVNEFKHLCDAVKMDGSVRDGDRTKATEALSIALDGPCILAKGERDIIAIGSSFNAISKLSNNPRRCGGQGDMLTGILAAFLAWAKTSLFKDGNDNVDIKKTMVIVALAASQLARSAAGETYSEIGRSLMTTDIVNRIPKILKEFEFNN